MELKFKMYWTDKALVYDTQSSDPNLIRELSSDRIATELLGECLINLLKSIS